MGAGRSGAPVRAAGVRSPGARIRCQLKRQSPCRLQRAQARDSSIGLFVVDMDSTEPGDGQARRRLSVAQIDRLSQRRYARYRCRVSAGYRARHRSGRPLGCRSRPRAPCHALVLARQATRPLTCRPGWCRSCRLRARRHETWLSDEVNRIVAGFLSGLISGMGSAFTSPPNDIDNGSASDACSAIELEDRSNGA